MIRSMTCLLWLIITGTLAAQVPVALHTSDPKFAPRWVDVPAPSIALTLERHYAGWAEGKRPPGTYEIAYCLVDESWKISPISPAVTVTATTSEWGCIGATPGVPLWTRAAGILWVFRLQGTTEWKPFGVDENRQHSWLSMKPYKPITGWHHEFAGHKLYQPGNYPTLSDTGFYPPSTVLPNPPPTPSVRLMECPNQDYEIAYSWPCNQGETALSPILTVPAIAGHDETRHTTMRLLRASPAGKQQPPQGALGMYLYMRKPNGNWHRQPSPDGAGYLWQLDYVSLPVSQFVKTHIAPATGGGRSYLSSLHLALTNWNRDIIIDNDVSICCPLISEYNGPSWDYQPKNHWLAVYGTTNGAGTWTLTVDGKTTPPMPRVSNIGNAWQQWRDTCDATFGVGNVLITDFWPLYAPRITLAGKWAATDMTGKVNVQVKDVAEAVVDPAIVAGDGYAGPQQDDGRGQGWILANAGIHKFKRKIATSNSGNWRVSDAATTPDGVTGYPTGWMHWLECTQRTKLQGCDFLMMQSRIGIATCDNSGGGAFHFNPVECTVSMHHSNTQPVTYGFRCIEASSWGWGGHLCSELIMEKVHLQCKFPIVCEGNQAANWQIRDVTCHSNGTFDSAIVTVANAGTLYLGGRFTCDNARTMIAAVWCKKVTTENLWIDGGMPALLTCNANSFTTLILSGGKINQWENWLHAIEAPAGSSEPYTMKLVTDNLDSQTNGTVEARMVSPKAGQLVYSPRVATEVPSLLGSLLP